MSVIIIIIIIISIAIFGALVGGSIGYLWRSVTVLERRVRLLEYSFTPRVVTAARRTVREVRPKMNGGGQ